MSTEALLDLTYRPPVQELPPWLSYSSSPTLTRTEVYSIATLDLNGLQTFIVGTQVQTLYETKLIQLPLTVDVPYEVGGPYTRAGGTGPTVASVVGAPDGQAALTIGIISSASILVPASSATMTNAPSVASSVSVTTSDTTANSVSFATTGPKSSDTASSSPLPRSSAVPGPSSVSADPANDLDGGQIAGIAVGVVFAALLLLLVMLCVRVRRLRKRRRREATVPREAVLHSTDWSYMPTVVQNGRRGSGATASTNAKEWWNDFVSLVTAKSSTRKTSHGTSTLVEKQNCKGSGSKETSPLTGDPDEGAVFEGMPMMTEKASPRMFFPTTVPRNRGSPKTYGTGLDSPRSRKMADTLDTRPETGALLDPFTARGQDDEPMRTPEMPHGWQGAATATTFLGGVHGHWLDTPDTAHGGNDSPGRTPQGYPRLNLEHPSDVYDEERQLEGSPTKRSPFLAEFDWMRRSPARGRLGSPAKRGGTGYSGLSAAPSGWFSHERSASEAGRSTTSSKREENLLDGSTDGQLFFNTPRWLGSTQTSAAGHSGIETPGSVYPDTLPESPLVYPFVSPLSPTKTGPETWNTGATPRVSAGSSAAPHPNREQNRNSDGMLDRIAASFGVALAGLGLASPGRSRQQSNRSATSDGSQSFATAPRRFGPRQMPRAAQPSTPERNRIRRSAAHPAFRPGSALGSAPPSPSVSAGTQGTMGSSRSSLERRGRSSDVDDDDEMEELWAIRLVDPPSQSMSGRRAPDIRDLQRISVTDFQSVAEAPFSPTMTSAKLPSPDIEPQASSGSDSGPAGSLSPSTLRHFASDSSHSPPGWQTSMPLPSPVATLGTSLVPYTVSRRNTLNRANDEEQTSVRTQSDGDEATGSDESVGGLVVGDVSPMMGLVRPGHSKNHSEHGSLGGSSFDGHRLGDEVE